MSYLEITCFCLQSKLLCPVDLNITSYTYIYDNMCCLNEINALKMKVEKKISPESKAQKKKVVGNYAYSGANFFYNDKISKIRQLEPKNRFFRRFFG